MNFVPTAFAATGVAEENLSTIPLFFGKAIVLAVIVVVAFILATLVRTWVQKILRKKQGDRHQEIVILYGRIAFTTVLIIGVVVGLTAVGAPLEYFSGGVGLGIAFALKNILMNFFAGIILLSNNKFNIGDYVILDEKTKGTIVDINSRATSLRSMDGGEITVPNADMLSARVTCYTKNPVRRHLIEIGVGYGVNLKEASDIILKVIKANEDIEPEPEPYVLVSEVADNSVRLEARFWTVSSAQWWITKSKITEEIFNTLQKAGIDIPYPVRTLRVDRDSSDLLAAQPNLLKNLEKIEAKKEAQAAVKKAVFTPTPNEIVTPNS